MRALVIGLILLGVPGCKSKPKAAPAASNPSAEPPTAPSSGAPAAPAGATPAPAAPTGTAPAAGPAPVTLKLGTGKRGGALDMKLIRSALEAHFDTMAHCYDGAASKAGTVQLAFRVGGDGKVTQSLAQGLGDDAIEKCHAKVVETIQFPAPPDGKDVTGFLPVIATRK